MKRSLLLLYCLLILPACLLVVPALASDESYIQTLSGKIHPGDSCVVVDDKFLRLPLNEWNQIRNLSVDNIIAFELRGDTSLFYYGRPFACKISLTIRYYTSRGQQTPDEIDNVDLHLLYDTASDRNQIISAVHRFRNAFKVVVIVKAITSAELGADLPAIFRLKNQILVERKYPFAKQVSAALTLQPSAANVVVQPADRQLTISWNTAEFPGAEAYDIEWTYLDAQGEQGRAIAGSYTSGNDYDVPDDVMQEWMRHDNTRVTVTGVYYTINLPYTDGYVAVRLRGVSYDANTNLRITTNWIYRNDNNHTAMVPVSAQEPTLNWQYTAAFAEEGKRNEMITYHDGSLRSRQAVTLNNSDNKAVVQESVYDAMGRAAMTVLPAPVDDDALKYYGPINLTATGAPYSAAHIELKTAIDEHTCRIGGEPLSTTRGAGAYYSANNPFINDPSYYFTRYVPDANGYPYALMEYTPDNTGRVRLQGGVGRTFQPDSDRVSQYFYGKPMQQELDRLFGMEAGNASHYLKNMVIDPNGQISVKYIDANGKTIATALAGEAPPAVDELPSAQGSNARVKLDQALLRPEDFKQDPGALQTLASATFLAAVSGTFKIYYSIAPKDILSAFDHDGVRFCNNCYYDISVAVRDACGELVADTTSAPFSRFDLECHDEGTTYNDSLKVVIYKPGEYTVTYKLQLSDEIVIRHTEYYIRNNAGLRTIQDFFKSELDLIELSGCYSECRTCQDKLRDQNVFVSEMNNLLVKLKNEKYQAYPDLDLGAQAIQDWITQTYANLLDECRARAANCPPPSPCEQYLDMMKADVRPGGQYALYNAVTTGNDESAITTYSYVERDISVLRFYNDPGSADIYNLSFTGDNGAVVYAHDLNESDFIAAYIQHPEWADAFVTRHIEYCGLDWCQQNVASVYFDLSLREDITTGSQAVLGHYFNRGDYNVLFRADPFFTGLGAAYAQQMQQDLANASNKLQIILKNSAGNALPGKNILLLIDWMLYCKPQDDAASSATFENSWLSCSVTDDCRSLTREWELYRNYYLKLKSRYVQLAKKTSYPNCTDCFIGGDLMQSCTPPTLSQYIIRDEGIGRDGIRFRLLFLEGSRPFPDNYIVNYSMDINGTVTHHTAEVNKGDLSAVLLEYTATASGIPRLSLLSMSCRNTTPNLSACANPVPPVEGPPCPPIGEFYLEERDYHKVSQFPCTRFEWTVWIVHSGGPVNRGVTVKINERSPTTGIVRQLLKRFAPGITEVQVGGYYWENGPSDEGCVNVDYRGAHILSSEAPVCDVIEQPTPAVTSTCRDDNRYPAYASKSRIFNDFVDDDGYTSCIMNGTRPDVDPTYTALRQQELANLGALKDNWLDRLRAVVAEENEQDAMQGVPPRFAGLEDLNNGTTINPKLVLLVDNLYQVAKKYIEIAPRENIRAASTLPSGITSVNGHNSFEDAFRAVLGDALMQQGFNPYLLDKPYPYDKTTIKANPNDGTAGTVLCTRMQVMLNRYQASGFGGSFHQYLQRELQEDYLLTDAQLQDILDRCGFGCRYLDEAVLLPAVFAGPVMHNGDHPFATCSRVNDLRILFEHDYPAVAHDTKLYRVLLTNYLNHHLGFPLAYGDYLAFMETCQNNGNAVLYNKPESPAIAYDDFSCIASIMPQVYSRAAEEYERYIEIQRRIFRRLYIGNCLGNPATARVKGDQYEYHFTLYYYDQAGNLVKTIPPEGVRLLNDLDARKVERLRESDNLCGASMPTIENKVATFNALSTALQTGTATAAELWLYNGGMGDSRHVRIFTPDHRYLFQVAVKGKTMWTELYTLTAAGGGYNATLVNRAVGRTPSAVAMQAWSHVVLQSTAFASVPWTLYLDAQKLDMLPAGQAPAYPFPFTSPVQPTDILADLKHLRVYNRPATDAEIMDDYTNACMVPVGALSSSPLLLWGRFNIPPICSTALPAFAGNRGYLQVTADMGMGHKFFADVANSFTVELWAKPQEPIELQTESQSGITGISGQRYAINPYWGGFPATGTAGMGISVGTNGVAVYEHADNYLPPLLVWSGTINTWTHIAVVYNNKRPSLYINGAWVRDGLMSTKDFVRPSYNFASGGYGVMQGGVDNVRIWNIARTGTDIQLTMRDGVMPAYNPALVGYWPIGPDDGTLIHDVTCRQNHVQLSGNGYAWQTDGTVVSEPVVVEYAERFIVPNHGMPTNYYYNSQNQVVKQISPDAGASQFWYDRLRRLVISQNAEQKQPLGGSSGITTVPNRYSYIRYDALGRIVETGEKVNSVAVAENVIRDNNYLTGFYASGQNYDCTLTLYDEAPAWTPASLLQRNLRKRVAASVKINGGADPANRSAATYYSYDISGNVEELAQEIVELIGWERARAPGAEGIKHVRYDYDLASGKVNKVLYQDGKWDQFYYQYVYDADNRLIKSLSSRENLADINLWITEATYRYYLHGPLARMELGNGNRKIQGVDYAYTLQGWLKGVNGTIPVLQADRDMSHDGFNEAGYQFQDVARDVYNFSLGYYGHDYTPIGGNARAFALPYRPPALPAAGQPRSTESGRALFNGNITYSTVAIEGIEGGSLAGYSYRYDQLNRLKGMDRHAIAGATTWNNGSIITAFKEQLSYDANGNIKTAHRDGAERPGMPRAMDDLYYSYALDEDGHLVNNKLTSVSDVVPDGNYPSDLDQSIHEDFDYTYDAIGNVIGAKTDKIRLVQWSFYGKIASVHTEDPVLSQGTDHYYSYDASGQRIRKEVRKWSQASSQQDYDYTYYIRDADGNVLATYKRSLEWDDHTPYHWAEQHLYGSSRLGMMKPDVFLHTSDAYSSINDPAGNGRIGNRLYELTNHLGNVLATVSNYLIGIDENSDGVTDYYRAEVVSAADYYPFGMLMPGRNYSSGQYRYGFNGKENDNEVKGDGNQQDYGMRIYDPRLGRFLSVDPITKQYPELTPYQFASNRPIDGIDRDGLEYARFDIYLDKNNNVTKIVVTKDYELKNNGSKGAGIEYSYHAADGMSVEYKFVKNIYGIYQGGDNPQLPKIGKNYEKRYDDYSLEPIDETDATAKQHDIDYDNAAPGGLKGAKGIVDDRSSAANVKYIKAAKKIIDKQKKGEKDTVTGKPVTKEAAEAAEFGKKWFIRAEALKGKDEDGNKKEKKPGTEYDSRHKD